MTGWRVYPPLLALVVVPLAGCGSGPDGPELAPPAQPRTMELNWVEPAKGSQFTFRVNRLVLSDDGWRADVSITNNSRTPYRLGERNIGLSFFDTSSTAELRRLTGNLQHAPPAMKPAEITPPPPPVLGPGAEWHGTISGSEVLRRGSVVRVLFGPFTSAGERFRSEVQDIFWVTDHSVRL